MRIDTLLCYAANADYVVADSLELTFISGQSANNAPSQCVELVVLDDNVLEITETINITLFSRSNYVVITAGRELAYIEIEEDNFDCELLFENEL